jgi:hypothetical protein
MREAATDTDNLDSERPDDRDAPGDTLLPSASGLDYYAVLGVAPYAGHEEIHSAYRRLAKRWHPDRYSRAAKPLRHRAERQMRLLTAAYAILGDETRRRAYDERRRAFGWADALRPASYASHRSQSHAAHEVAGNPNGAGQLAGILALILALALLGGAMNGGLASDPIAIVIFGGIAVLLVVAALFFSHASPLAHAATAWMEGEPRGYHVRYQVRYQPWTEPRREAAGG